MSDIARLDPKLSQFDAAKKATNVRRAGLLFNTYEHQIAVGDDWRLALERAYWLPSLDRLSAGTTVNVHSADHEIQFQLLVIDSNTAAGYLHFAFRPILPFDLVLPQPAPQIPPHFAVREAPGGGAFRVVDLTTGLPVHEGSLDRRGAEERANELEKGLAASDKQIAEAFSRHMAERGVTAPADADEDVSPGALRTRAYRARRRSGEAA